MKTYVTFGQNHTHRVNCHTLDCDTVAVIEAEDAKTGRAKAVEYFGTKFCASYAGDQWEEDKMLPYFPRGYTLLSETGL